MEVRVYEPVELKLQGIIEDYISLLWNRKYDGAGSFEFHAPATSFNIYYLRRGNIIAYVGAAEAGVIESFQIQQAADKNEIIVKGRFLESYLDRRLIYSTTGDSPAYNFSGYTEVAMRTLITNAVAIPLLTLGELNNFPEEITFQATYQNLLKYETKLADSMSAGFRISPDFVNGQLIFNVYKGLDHSVDQSERVRVVFSDEYQNINSAEYMENDQLLKTVCYVGGRGEGAERTWVIVGDNESTGLARREVKLDAVDIDPTDLTTAQYEAKLQQRGEDLLYNNSLIQSFGCDTVSNGNFVYRQHYDLGDIITLMKESWGIYVNLRITEITEAYEHGKLTITPTFGNPLPDTIDWEDK